MYAIISNTRAVRSLVQLRSTPQLPGRAGPITGPATALPSWAVLDGQPQPTSASARSAPALPCCGPTPLLFTQTSVVLQSLFTTICYTPTSEQCQAYTRNRDGPQPAKSTSSPQTESEGWGAHCCCKHWLSAPRSPRQAQTAENTRAPQHSAYALAVSLQSAIAFCFSLYSSAGTPQQVRELVRLQ